MPRYAKLQKVDSWRGAPMGRRTWNELPADFSTDVRGSLLRVSMHDGYDSGGAYWGSPNNLWCATFHVTWDRDHNTDYTGRTFVRASSRKEAIETTNKIKGWEHIVFRH